MYIATLNSGAKLRIHEVDFQNSGSNLIVTPPADASFTSKQVKELVNLGFSHVGKNQYLNMNPGKLDETLETLLEQMESYKQDERSILESSEMNLNFSSLTWQTGSGMAGTPVKEVDRNMDDVIYSIELDPEIPSHEEIVESLEMARDKGGLNIISYQTDTGEYSFQGTLEALEKATEKYAPTRGYSIKMLDKAPEREKEGLYISLQELPNNNAKGDKKNFAAYIFPKNYKEGKGFSLPTKLELSETLGGKFKTINVGQDHQVEALEVTMRGVNPALKAEDIKAGLNSVLHEYTSEAPLNLIARLNNGSEKGAHYLLFGDPKLDDVMLYHSGSKRNDFPQLPFSVYSNSCNNIIEVHQSLGPLLKKGTKLSENPALTDVSRYRFSEDRRQNVRDFYDNEIHSLDDAIKACTGELNCALTETAEAEFYDHLKTKEVSASISYDMFDTTTSGMKIPTSKLKDQGVYMAATEGRDGAIVTVVDNNGSDPLSVVLIAHAAKAYEAKRISTIRDLAEGRDVAPASVVSDIDRAARERERLAFAAQKAEALKQRAKENIERAQGFFDRARPFDTSWEFERKQITPTASPNLRMGTGKNDSQVLNARLTMLTSKPGVDRQTVSFQSIISPTRGARAGKLFTKDAPLRSNDLDGQGTAVFAFEPIDSSKPNYVIGEGVMDTYFNVESWGSKEELNRATTNYMAALNASGIEEAITFAAGKAKHSETQGKIVTVSDNDLYKPEVGNTGLLHAYTAMLGQVDPSTGKLSDNFVLRYPAIGKPTDSATREGLYTDPSDITQKGTATEQQTKLTRLLQGALPNKEIPRITVYSGKPHISNINGPAIDEDVQSFAEVRSALIKQIDAGQPFRISVDNSAILVKQLLRNHLATDRLNDRSFEGLLKDLAKNAPAPTFVRDVLVDKDGKAVVFEDKHFMANTIRMDTAKEDQSENPQHTIKGVTRDGSIWYPAGLLAASQPMINGYDIRAPLPKDVQVGQVVPANNTLSDGVMVKVQGDGHIALMQGDSITTKLLDESNKLITAESELGQKLGLKSDDVTIDHEGMIMNADRTPLSINDGSVFTKNQKDSKGALVTYIADSPSKDAKILLAGEPKELFVKYSAEIKPNGSFISHVSNVNEMISNYAQQSADIKYPDGETAAKTKFRDELKGSLLKTYLKAYNSNEHEYANKERYLEAARHLRDHGSKPNQHTDHKVALVQSIFNPDNFVQAVENAASRYKPSESTDPENEEAQERPKHIEINKAEKRTQILAAMLDHHGTVFLSPKNDPRGAYRIDKVEDEAYVMTFYGSDGNPTKKTFELSKNELSLLQSWNGIPELDIPSENMPANEKEEAQATFQKAIESLNPRAVLVEMSKPALVITDPENFNKTLAEVRAAEKTSKQNHDGVAVAKQLDNLSSVASDRSVSDELRGFAFSERIVALNKEVADPNLSLPIASMVGGYRPLRGGDIRNEELYDKKVADFESRKQEVLNQAEENGLSPESVRSRIEIIEEDKQAYIQRMSPKFGTAEVKHTSGAGREGRSGTVVPNDLEMFYSLESEGKSVFFPAAYLQFDKLYREAEDFGRAQAIATFKRPDESLKDQDPEQYNRDREKYFNQVKKNTDTYKPNPNDSRYVKPLTAEQRQDFEGFKVRGTAITHYQPGTNNLKIRFPNFQRDNKQLHRMTGHSILSGSTVQGYRRYDEAVDSKATKEFYYRIKNGSNKNYVDLHKDLVGYLKSEGVNITADMIKPVGYTRNSYHYEKTKQLEKLYEPEDYFAISVDERLTPVINNYLSDKGYLSIPEFEWIENPADNPSPYLTAKQMGQKEVQARQAFVEQLETTPERIRDPETNKHVPKEEAPVATPKPQSEMFDKETLAQAQAQAQARNDASQENTQDQQQTQSGPSR